MFYFFYFYSAKIRTIDDTMLHRRLGTILSYVTDDFSVTFQLIEFSFFVNTYIFFLKIINDNGILVISNELNINMKMNSSLWMHALEKFDHDVDINSMTKKEVKSRRFFL